LAQNIGAKAAHKMLMKLTPARVKAVTTLGQIKTDDVYRMIMGVRRLSSRGAWWGQKHADCLKMP